MNYNDDAVEQWKETRVHTGSTAGWMTRLERARDEEMLRAGVPQYLRIPARRSFEATRAAIKAVRS